MFLLIIWFAFTSMISAIVEEAPDGSVCFNNCNGHGHCVDYSCHCYPGYIGDDCRTTFADENDIVPILTAGHFNVSRKNFTQVISKNKLILVGFSSYQCHKCIQVEPIYRNVSTKLREMKIPFARGDADKMKSITAEVGATDLPALVLFQKLRPIVYKGIHSEEAIMMYLNKVISKPARTLKTKEDVTEFFNSRKNASYGISTAMTVGFFSEHEDIEEDDYEEFIEAAKELQLNEDLYFGVVTNPKTAAWFKTNKTIDRTPSMLLMGEDDHPHAVNLDELYGSDDGGIKSWVLKNALPLVGKMTGQNFLMYEKLGLPMLMMFLDLSNEHAVVTSSTTTATTEEGTRSTSSSSTAGYIGGKSGGIFNEELLDEFRLAAKEHRERVVFVYLDGVMHQDQMKSLGLYGGKERLPSIAFNTRDGSQVPFPEELPVNKDTILQFCANFLSGKLRSAEDSKEMAKKALQSALPVNPKNKAARKAVKQAPQVVQGISEQFGDGIRGDTAVVTVTLQNFEDVVMNEDQDVVLLLHAKGCEPCAHLAVYYKRMADRFQELAVPSLTIARMDVSTEAPPKDMNLMVGELPIIAMIPAGDKTPPWTFYSGISKVQQMMKWVHQQASIEFDLENLPHLSQVDKGRYKDQVREREEAKDKQRTEERRAAEKEEREQAELKRRKRNQEKRNKENAADATTATTATTSATEGTTSASASASETSKRVKITANGALLQKDTSGAGCDDRIDPVEKKPCKLAQPK
mmetsp:Transcript_5623/g.9247  ORF Transcript_5623/g.9247 Transcript_5623/m.9247 type:complete len:748 (-) Transcript_5623:127-2370(-)